MTRRRQALLGLVGLAAPGLGLTGPTLSQVVPKPAAAKSAVPEPAGRAAGATAGRKPAKQAATAKPSAKAPAATTSRPKPQAAAVKPRHKAPRPAEPSGQVATGHGRQEPPPPGTSDTASDAAPVPTRPARARDDGPSLRPVDRELVRNWMAAHPEWRSPGPSPRLAEGRPLPPDLPRRTLPPGLAVLLPYFPGYRYAAAGPDLVLYAIGTEVVASLLPGALGR